MLTASVFLVSFVAALAVFAVRDYSFVPARRTWRESYRRAIGF